MNKRRFKRAVLFMGVVALLIVGAIGLSLWRLQRQENLNRQLIAALINSDTQEALLLVNAGADPNAPLKLLPAPSLRQLWQRLFHRSSLLSNDSSRAFVLACGEYGSYDGPRAFSNCPESTQLVLAMLDHGAQVNVKDENGETPLLSAVHFSRLKTAVILLDHGANVNVQDENGWTPLMMASFLPTTVHTSNDWFIRLLLKRGAAINAQEKNGYTALYLTIGMSQFFSDREATDNFVRQLLAYGADPNLPASDGTTVLQIAQRIKRPDLVDLLRKAGAKK